MTDALVQQRQSLVEIEGLTPQHTDAISITTVPNVITANATVVAQVEQALIDQQRNSPKSSTTSIVSM